MKDWECVTYALFCGYYLCVACAKLRFGKNLTYEKNTRCGRQ